MNSITFNAFKHPHVHTVVGSDLLSRNSLVSDPNWMNHESYECKKFHRIWTSHLREIVCIS